jgi:hypothetical protein
VSSLIAASSHQHNVHASGLQVAITRLQIVFMMNPVGLQRESIVFAVGFLAANIMIASLTGSLG